MSDRISQIIQAESDADKLTGEADSLRWQAAELIAAELADGKSQVNLAAEIGKSRAHVQRMAKSWELHLKVHPAERPLFNEVYNSPEVRGQSKPAAGAVAEDGEVRDSCSTGAVDPRTASPELHTLSLECVPQSAPEGAGITRG